MDKLVAFLKSLTWTHFGGRRFVLCLGAGAITSILQYIGKLPPDGFVYRDVVLGTIGVFVAGNVTQKIKAPA